MSRRTLAGVAGILALMGIFGFAVYRGLGHFKRLSSSAAVAAPARPADTTAQLALPGTIYLSQGGDLFALHGTDFRAVVSADPRGNWGQPALLPDGNLLVIARRDASSDLYEVRPDGTVVGRLISGAATTLPDGSLENNHWVFTPHAAADGKTVWFSYDSPKSGFLVDLAIWSMPLTSPAPATSAQPVARPQLPVSARRWTTPNDYTGGDTDPVLLPSGALLYTKYSIDAKDKIHSQIWVTSSPRDDGHALTAAAQDCSQPALSPDGTHLAMVCTNGDQVSRLVEAPLLAAPAGSTPGVAPQAGPALGAQRVLVDGTLVAQPVWSPAGDGLIYLAPAETGANFQLWWLAGASTSGPRAPAQVTTSLGFDATSRPVWSAG
ncbi:MAG TPA: hypothetical protein VI316_00200 [Candidatus Dormibacteraeota bacterium]